MSRKKVNSRCLSFNIILLDAQFDFNHYFPTNFDRIRHISADFQFYVWDTHSNRVFLQQLPGKISDFLISFFHEAVCVDLHRYMQLPDGLENSRIMTQPDIPLQVGENRLAVTLRPDAGDKRPNLRDAGSGRKLRQSIF